MTPDQSPDAAIDAATGSVDGSASDARSEAFFAGAVARIARFILALGAPAALVVLFWLGWKSALGCVFGVAAGYESFASLAKAVNALAERISTGESREHGGRIVARFLARYLLVAVAAYVIFTVSRSALYGFIAGLCVPVLAMMCEAGYELYMALRRGM